VTPFGDETIELVPVNRISDRRSKTDRIKASGEPGRADCLTLFGVQVGYSSSP
jgi:hypothetical protein